MLIDYALGGVAIGILVPHAILDAIWFMKCNINDNGNDSYSNTSDNKFK